MQRMLVSETARRALLATVAVFAWEPAAAQLVPQAGTQSAAQIEEILVVGARLPRPVQDVVGTVDVISRDNLLDSIALDAAGAVRYLPGVSAAQSDNRFGVTEFTIRGLSGNRVTTLIDGVPVADQFDIGSFSNAGQDFLVPDTVSRIEILRGPASTLFGSDALGGVVAIITRDPEEYLDGRSSHLSASTTYSGADQSRVATVAAARSAGSLAGVLHGSIRDAEEMDAAGTSQEDPLERQRVTAQLKLGYTLASGNTLRLNGQFFEEDVESQSLALLGYSRQFRNTTALAGDDTRRRYAAQLEYDFDVSGAWAEYGRVNLYAQRSRADQDTHELRERTNPPVAIDRNFEYEFEDIGAVLDFESPFEWGDVAHRIAWGVSLRQSEVEEQRDGLQRNLLTQSTTNLLLGENLPVRDFPKSRVVESAAYLHDEIRLGRLLLIPGLRAETYRLDARADELYRKTNPGAAVEDVSESAVVPKLGAQWRASERVDLFAQYARGFRAPPFEDVNIGLDIPSFNIRAIPNPDLESETSDGLELGLRYQGEEIRVELALFGADYDDFIESKVNLGPDPDTGVLLFQSRNIDRARIYGAELSFSRQLAATVDLSTSANWTRGEDRDSGEPINTIDPPSLVTLLNWRPAERWSGGLAITAAAAQSRVDQSLTELYEPDGYVVFDLTARYEPRHNVRIHVGLFNITNETYWRWASVRGRPEGDPLTDLLAAPGRNGAISMHVSL